MHQLGCLKTLQITGWMTYQLVQDFSNEQYKGSIKNQSDRLIDVYEKNWSTLQ